VASCVHVLQLTKNSVLLRKRRSLIHGFPQLHLTSCPIQRAQRASLPTYCRAFERHSMRRKHVSFALLDYFLLSATELRSLVVRKAVLGMMAVRRLTLSPHLHAHDLARTVEGYKETAEQVMNEYSVSIPPRAYCYSDRNTLMRSRRLSSTMAMNQHLRAPLIKARLFEPASNVLPGPQATTNPKSLHPRNLMKQAHLGTCLEMVPRMLSLLQLVVLPLPHFLLARNHEHSLFVTASLVLLTCYITPRT
jgi:hypothetical protein